MSKNNYSIVFTGIIIIILIFILTGLIINKSKNKLPSKESMNINNNIVFPVETPKLDNNETNYSGDLIVEEEKKIIDIVNSNTGESIKKQEVYNKILEEKKVIDTINTAGETGKSELCNDIQNKTEKIKCIGYSYATKSSIDKNPDLCYKISNIELKNGCLDNYYNNQALKTFDYNICTKIINSNLKDSCKYIIILKKIESLDLSQGIEICDVLNGENKTYCRYKFISQTEGDILQKAINSLDIKLCDNITINTEKNKCKDVINFKIAINTNDKNKCLEINDENLKSQCDDTLFNIN